MTFAEIMKSLGFSEYPEKMEAIYREVEAGAAPLFDRALIDHLHSKLELFGQYYEAVVAGYEDLLTKPQAYAYAQVAARFLQQATYSEAKTIPIPGPDGSPALDMLPLLVEMTAAERGIAEYVKRGVELEDATARLTRVFRSDIAVNIRRHGRPGLDRLYFNWITNYIYAMLFPCQGFQFNISQLGNSLYVLKNKADGRVVVLMDGQKVHRCGKILGSAGLTDTEGSFCTAVTQTEEGFTGYPANEKGLIQSEKQFYPKTQWVLAVKPGDSILNIHLPAGVNLDKQATRSAIRGAFAHAKKYYPEYQISCLHCGSWLLNPELEEALGPNSNIMNFISLFHLHPQKCAGKGVFNFVFRSSVDPDLATLPEDTRLQRWLKAKYLAGGYHHNFGGFILPEEL